MLELNANDYIVSSCWQWLGINS